LTWVGLPARCRSLAGLANGIGKHGTGKRYWQTTMNRVVALVQALCGENVVARLAATVTVSRADAPAVPRLCQALRERTRPWPVRWSLTTALGRIGSPECVPTLLEVTADAFQPGDEWVRHGAVQALARFRMPQALPALIDRLEDLVTPADFWPENRICDVAIGALTGIDTRNARAVVAGWRQEYRTKLSEEDPGLRLTAAIALAFAGDGAGRPALLQYMGSLSLRKHPSLVAFHPYQVERAIEALNEAPLPPLDEGPDPLH